MTVGQICSRVVDTADAEESAHSVAQRMLDGNVGSLPVLDVDGRLVGIVTDRDLALRVIAEHRDGRNTQVAEVMSECVQTVREDAALEVALAAMRKRGVRRIPVVDADDKLVGILAFDDVLALLGEQIGAMGSILESESPRKLQFVPDEPPAESTPVRPAAQLRPAGTPSVNLAPIERALAEIRDALDVVACAASIGLEVRLLGGGVIEGDVRAAADRRLAAILERTGRGSAPTTASE